MPRRSDLTLGALALAAALIVGCAGKTEPASSREVTLNDTPTSVREAIQRIVGTGTIDEIEREIEDGQLSYEVDFKKDAVEYSVTLSEDGRVLEEERSLSELPIVLTASIASRYPDVLVESVTVVRVPGVESASQTYEVTVANARIRRELTMNADGEILKDVAAGKKD
jgi:uncharacterized membrane protein YkoI